LKVIYSARYRIDIGPHVFPTAKYQIIHARLLAARVASPADVVEPEAASWDELALVHTNEYLAKLREGNLTDEEIGILQLPWSFAMVEGFRLMVGGTVEAARRAVAPERPAFKIVCHLGGGLHHAFPNHGEGFCVFNDVAVAIRVLQRQGIERVAIVDLDVHHGNGTAFIFNPRGVPPPPGAGVFTFSMHQQHNYPLWKPRGSLDIGLPDGAGDATFLGHLERALPEVVAHAPQCVFYLAGADPYHDDQLGGLRLTKDGLRQRDRLVMQAAKAAGVPLVVTLAGGYARRFDDTVAIHCATIEEAAAVSTLG
jgi:acetoin utilization deacetylase AcuC-like enzyme